MTLQPQILLVDDTFEKRFALKAVLTPLGFPIVEADSGLAAMRCVMEEEFAVILMDVCMPTMDGFETASFLRQREQSELTPIIFITAFDNDELRNIDHYTEGAVDFIFAPVDPEELRAKVTVFAGLFSRASELAIHAQEVQISADRLRLLTDAAPIGIFQTNAANRYVYTNPRWTQIMGIDAVDAAGQIWEEFGVPDQWNGNGGEPEKVSTPPTEMSKYLSIRRPGSASQVIHVIAASIPDGAGGTAGWVGTVADVTAQATAETAASHFRAVVESSHDAIISKDLDGIITSWNTGAQRLYGYTSAETIGCSISLLVPPGDEEDVPRLLDRSRGGEIVESYETVRRRKDGSIVDVSLTTSPILGPGGAVTGASIIARDISDRRKAEQLKDEFLALVSHELRTPLSSIVAHIELLLDDDLVDAHLRRQFMEVIDRNSMRLERLVGDLLFVAQLESANLSLTLTEVDVVAVVIEAVEGVRPGAQQSDLDISLVVPEGPVMLAGDPGRLGQAVDNLLSNAIKYSPEGGTVIARVRLVDGECIVEIEDHGMGIAADEQGHLFDRFYRASEVVSRHIQGVGLGLSIVKRIVEGHGGRVSVVSELGFGSTFRIALPIGQPSQTLARSGVTSSNSQKVS